MYGQNQAATGAPRKNDTTAAVCAFEPELCTSKLTRAVAIARAIHLEATGAIDVIAASFAKTLRLRRPHAHFAAHFLHALDLRRACAASGIGYETGRTYLKKLFEVTGSSSQVELAIILANLKPQ